MLHRVDKSITLSKCMPWTSKDCFTIPKTCTVCSIPYSSEYERCGTFFVIQVQHLLTVERGVYSGEAA